MQIRAIELCVPKLGLVEFGSAQIRVGKVSAFKFRFLEFAAGEIRVAKNAVGRVSSVISSSIGRQ